MHQLKFAIHVLADEPNLEIVPNGTIAGVFNDHALNGDRLYDDDLLVSVRIVLHQLFLGLLIGWPGRA